MNRRKFVSMVGGSIGLAGLSTGCTTRNGSSAGRRLHSIGLQLYTVRDLMAKDAVQTLKDVAAVGYDEVEFAGYHGHEPAQLKMILDDLGMTAPSTHWSPPGLFTDPTSWSDALQETLDSANVLGHRYLVFPWLPDHESLTADDYHRIADVCAATGMICSKAGIQFAYHNHDFEFRELDGQVPMEILLDNTPAGAMQWEMDFYWVRKAGRDPFEYFDRYPGRISMCHVKDMGEGEEMVDVGAGGIDFAALFAQSDIAGLEHYFVEHDNPADPLATIRNSFDYLNSLSFSPSGG